MSDSILSQEYLLECLSYNAETGSATWNRRPRDHFRTTRGWRTFLSQKSGKEVGSISSQGYLQININKEIYLLHRVIWMLLHNERPGQIDHINGCRTDNRIENLRSVTYIENNKNMGLRRDNLSGIIGVNWSKHIGKWRSRIGARGVNIHLGAFDDFFEACCSRKSAEVRYGYHTNHGRR